MNSQSPSPLVSDVALIGGGHAHALLLRQWGMNPVAGAQLTLVNPAPTAPYTGMLPGFVAGHYSRDALEIDLVRLARFAGARIVFGKVTAIDRDAKSLQVEGHPDIFYDIASINIGITSDMPSIVGFSEFGIPAKPLGQFAKRWQAFVDNHENGPIAVIGGGVAGVELALAMHYRLSKSNSLARVTLIESATLLSGSSAATQQKLRAALRDADIRIIEGAAPVSIYSDHLELSDGREVASVFTVGAAGARPFDWLQSTSLDLTNGYVSVDASLRSLNDKSIYAVGDCAHLIHAPRPKAGVFAVRSAKVLTANIRADLAGSARKRFEPQSQYLKLVSLGRKSAVADKYDRAVSGNWAWAWKDWIDRRFMDRLNNPPKMPSPTPTKGAAKDVAKVLGDKPMCGGCGSKVGATILDNVLATLPTPTTSGISKATGDDAAIISFGKQQQVISTDHLRAFWADPYVMSRIAALHAMGDVWAMGAKPQAMLAQIILPRMSEPLQARYLREILAAAGEVAAETGSALVGGHTTQGAELTLGFTVTGTVQSTAKTFEKARAGDVLILTRPIGSGTLMAAEMAGEAAGDDIANVVKTMSRSQSGPAEILAQAAHSMTDVTGFGLAGHAQRMAAAAGLTAHINSTTIPFYPGAHRLAERGIASTLAPTNRASLMIALPETPAASLLVDPQTAGGFLAAVPEENANATLNSLNGIGTEASIVGTLSDWTGQPLKVC
ncbi:MAG: selenide, water dikinase SelD [Boseongicola sp.]|nr:selenide, water dikinase SelD [Boseongicola sp.]